MKKYLFLSVAVLLLAGTSALTSCKSKQPVAQPYPNYTTAPNYPAPTAPATSQQQRVEEEIDDCEKESMKMEGDLLRAYGSAIDYDKDFARQIAATNARAQMASDIKSLVTNIMKNYRSTTRQNAATTSSARVEQDITSIADEVIARTTIICSKRYKLADGRYECTVCISMAGSMEEEVGGAILTEDKKLGVQFEAEQFRKAYQEELARYRAEKNQQ